MDSDGAYILMVLDIGIIPDISAFSGTLFYPGKFSSGYSYLRAVLQREKVAVLHCFVALLQESVPESRQDVKPFNVCDSLGSNAHAPLLPREEERERVSSISNKTPLHVLP